MMSHREMDVIFTRVRNVGLGPGQCPEVRVAAKPDHLSRIPGSHILE